MLLRRLVLIPLVLLANGACRSDPEVSPGPSTEGRFAPLFNGGDLDGWEGNPEFFRIQEEAIVAGRLDVPIPRNEFLCTRRVFADFEMRLQARTSREGANGGIQFRSRRVPSSPAVSGFQADIGILGDGRNIWGALYDESRRAELLAVPDQARLREVYRPGDWNDYVIRAEGDRIQLWINGYRTVDYREADPEIEHSGVICLQTHRGPPSEIRYRKLMIRVP